MLAILGLSRTGAKTDDISVLGQVAWLLGRPDLIIDNLSFPNFVLLDDYESSVSCRPSKSSIGPQVYLIVIA